MPAYWSSYSSVSNVVVVWSNSNSIYDVYCKNRVSCQEVIRVVCITSNNCLAAYAMQRAGGEGKK